MITEDATIWGTPALLIWASRATQLGDDTRKEETEL